MNSGLRAFARLENKLSTEVQRDVVDATLENGQ
jgi:hypothetical protein